MPLSTEVGLVPGHNVLDGDPVPVPKGLQPPIFGPCLLWPNRPSQLLHAEHLLGSIHHLHSQDAATNIEAKYVKRRGSMPFRGRKTNTNQYLTFTPPFPKTAISGPEFNGT